MRSLHASLLLLLGASSALAQEAPFMRYELNAPLLIGTESGEETRSIAVSLDGPGEVEVRSGASIASSFSSDVADVNWTLSPVLPWIDIVDGRVTASAPFVASRTEYAFHATGARNGFESGSAGPLSVVVHPMPALAYSATAKIPLNHAFSASPSLTGMRGEPVCSTTLSSGSLPPGITVKANCVVSGMPSTTGQPFVATVSGWDSADLVPFQASLSLQVETATAAAIRPSSVSTAWETISTTPMPASLAGLYDGDLATEVYRYKLRRAGDTNHSQTQFVFASPVLVDTCSITVISSNMPSTVNLVFLVQSYSGGPTAYYNQSVPRTSPNSVSYTGPCGPSPLQFNAKTIGMVAANMNADYAITEMKVGFNGVFAP